MKSESLRLIVGGLDPVLSVGSNKASSITAVTETCWKPFESVNPSFSTFVASSTELLNKFSQR